MRIKVIFSVIMALALLVSSCTQPAPQEQSPAPITGGELVRLGADPPTLDPHLASDTSAALMIVEIFGGLVTLDRDLQVVPDLAEKWNVSDDGKTYTFTIRKNARFHDGKPVTANDFKWSIERAANPKLLSVTADTYLGDIVGVKEKLNGKSQDVSGVKVINDSTLEITIDAPKVYFISKLTYPTAFVLDQANVESGADWYKKANGTGPFKLGEYNPGEILVLERNADYHLGAPKLERVKSLLAGGSGMVMYENNEIHFTGVGLADLDRVKDPSSPLNKELRIAPPGFETFYIGLNVTKPPLDDIKVRQALTYAINKPEIAAKVLNDRVKPAFGILPPGFPGFNAELKGQTFDLDKAKKLMAESKYGPDPKKWPRLTMTVAGDLGTAIGLDLEAILAMWRDNLGIEVEVQQVEWATFLEDVNAYRLQMFSLGWVADYPDPQNFLDLLFHSQSQNNQTRYSNTEVDRLLEQARTEKDEKTRFSLYQKAEQIIVEEASWIPTWYEGEGYLLIKPEVKDFLLLPIIVPKYRYIYLEQKSY